MGTGTENSVNNERGSKGTNYLIAIGIDDYTNAANKYRKIPSSREDATRVIKILSEKYSFTLLGSVFGKQATRANIRKLFDGIIPDIGRSLGHENDSLIIYFSGHGEIIKTNNGSWGLWVPADCKAKRLEDYFSMKDLTIDILPQINFLHTVVISDCCHSGEMLAVPTFYNFSPNPSSPALDWEESPSCYAICSSRANELSMGARTGNTSLFTTKLLDLLENNVLDKYIIDSLLGDLAVAFDDEQMQKPIHGPLPSIQNNSGKFAFKAKPDLLRAARKRNYLSKGFATLNYRNQRDEFPRFDLTNTQKLVSIFSGTATCGLRYIAHEAKGSVGLIPYHKTAYILPTILCNEPIDLLRAALREPLPTDELLKQHIREIAEELNIIFELRFYSEKNQGDDSTIQESFTPGAKKHIVEEMVRFLESISYKGNNRLVLFLVDEEKCDYQQLFAGSNISNTETIYFKPVDPVKEMEARAWYNILQNSYRDRRNPNKVSEFNQYFDVDTNGNLPAIIGETKGAPALVIRSICDKAECPNLSYEILDPK